MYSFKKSVNSQLFKFVESGLFTAAPATFRAQKYLFSNSSSSSNNNNNNNFENNRNYHLELACVSDRIVNLYSINEAQNITQISKFEADSVILSIAVLHHFEGNEPDQLLISTQNHELILLRFLKSPILSKQLLVQSLQQQKQAFQDSPQSTLGDLQEIARYSYAEFNEKVPKIHQLGAHIFVVGDEKKPCILVTGFMENIIALSLDYSNPLLSPNQAVFEKLGGMIFQLKNKLITCAKSKPGFSAKLTFDVLVCELFDSKKSQTSLITLTLSPASPSTAQSQSGNQQQQQSHQNRLQINEKLTFDIHLKSECVEIPLDFVHITNNKSKRVLSSENYDYMIITSESLVECNHDFSQQHFIPIDSIGLPLSIKTQPSNSVASRHSSHTCFITFSHGKYVELEDIDDDDEDDSEEQERSLGVAKTNVLQKKSVDTSQKRQQWRSVSNSPLVSQMFSEDLQCVAGIAPSESFPFWVSVSNASIAVGVHSHPKRGKVSSYVLLNSIPLFTGILSSALDTPRSQFYARSQEEESLQNQSIYSILSDCRNNSLQGEQYLRKITAAVDVNDIRVLSSSFPKDISHAFVINQSNEVSVQQEIILSSLMRSYWLTIISEQNCQRVDLNLARKQVEESTQRRFVLRSMSQVVNCINESEVVHGVICDESKGILVLVLNSRVVVLNSSNGNNDYSLKQSVSILNQSRGEQLQRIAKCTVSQKENLIFISTLANDVLAYAIKEDGTLIQLEVQCHADSRNQFSSQISCFKLGQRRRKSNNKNNNAKQFNANVSSQQVENVSIESSIYDNKTQEEIISSSNHATTTNEESNVECLLQNELCVGFYDRRIEFIDLTVNIDAATVILSNVRSYSMQGTPHDILYFSNGLNQQMSEGDLRETNSRDGVLVTLRGGILIDFILQQSKVNFDGTCGETDNGIQVVVGEVVAGKQIRNQKEYVMKQIKLESNRSFNLVASNEKGVFFLQSNAELLMYRVIRNAGVSSADSVQFKPEIQLNDWESKIYQLNVSNSKYSQITSKFNLLLLLDMPITPLLSSSIDRSSCAWYMLCGNHLMSCARIDSERDCDENKSIRLKLSHMHGAETNNGTSASNLVQQQAMKRIVFFAAIDAFVMIGEFGTMYFMNRFGGIVQSVDLNAVFPMICVKHMKEFVLDEAGYSILGVMSERHGLILLEISLVSQALSSQTSNRFLVSVLESISVFANEQMQLILRDPVIDATYMLAEKLLIVAAKNVMNAFHISRESIESSSRGLLSVRSNHEQQLQQKQQQQQKDEQSNCNLQKREQRSSSLLGCYSLPAEKCIVSLDAMQNSILVGEKKDSFYVFSLTKVDIGGSKSILRWSLQRTEYELRAVKEGIFVNNSQVLGIDKYGDLFSSILDSKSYIDANLNLNNYANMNVCETGQLIKNDREILDSLVKTNEIGLCKSQIVRTSPHVNYKEIVFCGISGSVYRIAFFDLLFSFQSEKYNEYIWKVQSILEARETKDKQPFGTTVMIKSKKLSRKESGLNSSGCSSSGSGNNKMRISRSNSNSVQPVNVNVQRGKKKSQNFLDLKVFENLNKSDYEEVYNSLRAMLTPDEAEELLLQEFAVLMDFLSNLFLTK